MTLAVKKALISEFLAHMSSLHPHGISKYGWPHALPSVFV